MMELLDYAVMIGHELQTTPYCEELGVIDRWHVCFKNCELLTSGYLTSTFGSSIDVEAALVSYALKISGETLIFHSHNSEKRAEFKVPADLEHTPEYRPSK